MVLAPRFITPPPIPLYTGDAALFDGTNDSTARGADWTNSADGKSGIVSFWFLHTAGSDPDEMWFIDSTSNRFFVQRLGTTGKFVIEGRNAAATTILKMTTNTGWTVDGLWHHYLASWDLANTTGWLYVDGANDLAAGGTFTNDSIDHTVTEHYICGPGGNLVNSAVFDMYLNIDTFLDLSVAANVQKFRSAAGKPVDLGADGSTPTGAQPTGFFHLDVGETAANWAVNAGDGGGMTVTGALATASTSPTD